MTHLNKILKMVDKDKERIFHEIVQNEFAFEKVWQRRFLEAKKI